MPERDNTQPGGGKPSAPYPQAFVQAVRDALAGLGWKVRRWTDGGVDVRDDKGAKSSIGLENVWRRLRGKDSAGWAEAVRQFLLSAHPTAAPELLSASELPAAADRLLVRLRAPGTGKVEELLWARGLQHTDLVITLVVDHPNNMRFVTHDMLRDSGKSGEEWLPAALANLRAATPPGYLDTITGQSGVSVLLGCRNDAYDAARAMIVEELVPDAPHGLFVAVPSRDCLLVQRVEREALLHLGQFKNLAAAFHRDKPYPISDEVYWVQGGVWQVFGVKRDEEKNALQLTPPETFVPVLEELLGSAHDPQPAEGPPPAE